MFVVDGGKCVKYTLIDLYQIIQYFSLIFNLAADIQFIIRSCGHRSRVYWMQYFPHQFSIDHVSILKCHVLFGIVRYYFIQTMLNWAYNLKESVGFN